MHCTRAWYDDGTPESGPSGGRCHNLATTLDERGDAICAECARLDREADEMGAAYDAAEAQWYAALTPEQRASWDAYCADEARYHEEQEAQWRLRHSR